MTSLIIGANRGSKAREGSSPLALLDPAMSARTHELAHRVLALHSRPSPSSFPLDVSPAARERPLQERLFEALAGVKVLTAQVAMHLDKEWRSRLFRQLDALHDPDEWEDGDQPIQQSSFSTFLKAVLAINPARRPGFGLSSAGHFVAAWTTGPDRLTIEFLPDDRVRWVLSRQYDDGETERLAGDTSVARLAQSLAFYNPQHWFGHAAQER